MKRATFTILFLIAVSNLLWAQSNEKANKEWGLTVRRTWQDYKTPIQKDELNLNFDKMGEGLEIAFFQRIRPFLDITVPVRIGAARFPIDSLHSTARTLFYGVDGLFKLHWPHKKNFLAPYMVFGAAGMMNDRERKADVQFPLGVGFDIRLGAGTYLNLESQYRYALTDYRTHLQHALGFTFDLGGAAPEKPKPLPPADSDGDGIIDKEDKCPNVKGLAAFSGCPDTDSDGIADMDDNCPNEKGPKSNNGCPVLDRDGDGVVDADDRCPDEKGPANNYGCPIKDRDGDGFSDDIDDCPDIKGTLNGCPDSDGDGTIDPKDKCPNVKGPLELDGCPDSDGDGVADNLDKCPNKKGPKSNNGCPEIKKEDIEHLKAISKNIRFNTARTTLKPESKPILDEIAALMVKYPDYHLTISGHTDSIGSAESNQKLSEGRAKTCYNYLVRKGISPERMSYVGYGETQPIADNKYKEGRAKNRRVEFYLYIPTNK